ncbi:MAG: T9SS type A sorting domain-containing protein [Bacteroidales bacterium]|nr:T9SS type A sorting domain-containing protein [Bacteroidales bacterium]
MKKIFFVLLACVALCTAQGQRFEWVRTYTGPDISGMTTNKIVGSCVDSLGNLYILGEFSPQAQLCGVDLLPHEIITTPLRRAVVIAKLSSDGNLLWHKSIYGTYSSCYAHDLCQMGDTAFMVKVGIELPFDVGYGQFNNLYYLDTLLTGGNDYLMSTDSIGEYIVNAFITFENDGDVLEQHFLCVGWQDTNGNTLTPLFLGQNTMDKMFCNMFSSETFNIDSEGNIYVIRTSNDCKFNPDNGQEWSVVDGTIGALKIMVDGVHALYCYPTQRSALWNQQIFKFSPHFDSLIAAVYVFDSTKEMSRDINISIVSSEFDADGNMYFNMIGSTLPPSIRIANSNTFIVDLQSDLFPTWILKYNSNLQPTGLFQLKSIDNFPVSIKVINTHFDDENNCVYLSGGCKWSSINPDIARVPVSQDTIAMQNLSGFWLRLNCNDELESYWKSRPMAGGQTHNPLLATCRNRVFAQTFFYEGLCFGDTLLHANTTNGKDLAFMVWDNEGHELSIDNRGVSHPDNIANKPIVIDSIVYLTGSLYDNATWGTLTTNTVGPSYAYIAKYVDPEFMVPYLPESERLAQSIEWDQELQLSLADSTVALTATSTSGLPVKYACSDTNIARVVGSTLHLLSEGDALVTASQPGNSQYRPADPMTKLLHVSSTGIAQGERPILAVYPNPARDVLNLDLGGEILLHATAKSVLGQAWPVDVGISWVEVASLPAGTYLLEVETCRHNKYTTYFVKQ